MKKQLLKGIKGKIVQPLVLWVLFVAVLIFGIWFSQHRVKSTVDRVVERVGEDVQGLREAPKVGDKVINLQDSFSSVAAVVMPAVVNISAIHIESYEAMPYEFYFGDPFEDFFREFFGQPQIPKEKKPSPKQFKRKYEGTGSGVIIDEEGYILTNEHVIRDADEIKVTLANRGEAQNFTGKVIGRDPQTDLAVIKIKSSKPFPYAKLGNSDGLSVGDWAIAIGSPFGLEQTLTVGVISAVRQSLVIEGRRYKNLIQTDAAINRGNSGGPLVNIRGEVIAINTAIYAPTGVFAGVGFATPINQAKIILDDLIKKGRVIRGWMGVEIAGVDAVIAKQFNLPDANGVLVNSVFEGSPAEKAGFKRGDVIVSFAGKDIKSVEELQERVAATQPNKEVLVKIVRDGKKKELKLMIGEMPSGPGELSEEKEEDRQKKNEYSWEGLRIIDFDERIARRFGLKDVSKGVIVIEVEPGSEADSIGLIEGDLISAVNRNLTPDLTVFRKIVKNVDLSKGVVFDINRRGRPIYLSYQSTK